MNVLKQLEIRLVGQPDSPHSAALKELIKASWHYLKPMPPAFA